MLLLNPLWKQVSRLKKNLIIVLKFLEMRFHNTCNKIQQMLDVTYEFSKKIYLFSFCKLLSVLFWETTTSTRISKIVSARIFKKLFPQLAVDKHEKE
jgi:hypothetical protein